ncbi:phytanoyl-CoA dioxygenase family protein [Brevundimonas sp. NIBR11]|uniref:phytanoyl-CoA dioxygenase family protein n=1 Tax=Brevundimonas sp. NIBR11 TaxID=3015999 RepID=UPI0022EFE1CF|nr:phytanoyl-CoA dioxygenase family protein [Brevundimonas sp. NIBR11]WGM30097.1 hypothetical protein KKHFBJBL_00312 [Brevundimonas sp. NIBR11]
MNPEDLATRGAVRVRAALSQDQVEAFEAALSGVRTDQAGIRLAGDAALGALLSGTSVPARLATEAAGHPAFPVRAILFDKGSENNWGLGWHQDRTIAVKARHEVDGFGPWSIKGGLQHVAPPFEVLQGMITLRLHLDAVDEDNAPLLVLPGSHRMGRLSEADVKIVAEQTPSAVCLADRGDIWVYSTPIVHASKPATKPSRRRVLQVDYAHAALPGGLEWLDV